MKMVQEQGHCVLWPLLFDCTSTNVHDREISETALKSLCELYESDGSHTRADLFLKSFHYFNFQINQALSFNQYDLQRAILALKRSLDDYKNTCALKDISMPDTFLWGALSFVKNVIQRPEIQLHAFILLDSFLDILSESMLFRVFSEVLVCVAAAFERLHAFTAQFTSQDARFLQLTPEQWRQHCAVEAKPKAPTQTTIVSFFSQAKNDPANSERFIEESGIFLSIYGSAEIAQNSAPFKDPLFSFTKATLTVIQNDPEAYEAAMSDFFAAIIKRIAAKFPAQIMECLNSRPYLYFLKYGQSYINTL
ncbi:hypothetical protein WA577_007353, partial [Blastocystis sp. JDR]